MRKHTHLAVSCLWLIALLVGATTAHAVPMLWGVDEDDGELFSIADYTQIGGGPAAAGLTVYGRLRYREDDGSVSNVGNDIEAFTLDVDGTAYMAINDDMDDVDGLGDVDEPVLLRFNINDASTTDDNIVTVIGRINAAGYDASDGDNISGLSIDPRSGDLYGLFRHDGDAVDRLLILNKTTAGVVNDIGTMAGLGEEVESGEDIEFDAAGNLYVTDNDDDHLYRVDRLTAAIVTVIDDDEGGSVKYEGLGWDFENDRLIGTEDHNELFTHLTLQNDSNIVYGSFAGLTDVEGIDFVPTAEPPDGVIPEPSAGAILLLGLLAVRRRR